MKTRVLLRVDRSGVTHPEHLSAATMGSLIDRTTSVDERRRAELHLSRCKRCREEFAACARLTSTIPNPAPRRRWWAWVGVAAATVVVAIGIRARSASDDRPVSRERATTTDTSGITTISPRNSNIARTGLRFVWRRDEQSTGYHIVVTNANGVPVWTQDLADTSAAPPSSLRLEAGYSYFWRVDALRADGTTIKSKESLFQIRPE